LRRAAAVAKRLATIGKVVRVPDGRVGTVQSVREDSFLVVFEDASVRWGVGPRALIAKSEVLLKKRVRLTDWRVGTVESSGHGWFLVVFDDGTPPVRRRRSEMALVGCESSRSDFVQIKEAHFKYKSLAFLESADAKAEAEAGVEIRAEAGAEGVDVALVAHADDDAVGVINGSGVGGSSSTAAPPVADARSGGHYESSEHGSSVGSGSSGDVVTGAAGAEVSADENKVEGKHDSGLRDLRATAVVAGARGDAIAHENVPRAFPEGDAIAHEIELEGVPRVRAMGSDGGTRSGSAGAGRARRSSGGGDGSGSDSDSGGLSGRGSSGATTPPDAFAGSDSSDDGAEPLCHHCNMGAGCFDRSNGTCRAPAFDVLLQCDECMLCFHGPCLDPPQQTSTPLGSESTWRCRDCERCKGCGVQCNTMVAMVESHGAAAGLRLGAFHLDGSALIASISR
jgi:hypothetical protein